MTIHRALAELKLIDAKITKLISEADPCGIYQKGKMIDNHIPEEEFKRRAQSGYDSVLDLISRKSQIKSSIVQANASTVVKIAGKEMTISEAIHAKGSIVFKKQFIDILKRKLAAAVAALNKQNEVVNKNVQAIIEVTFSKDNVKVDKNDIDAVRKPYMESNEFHLANPLEIEKKIADLEKEVQDFEMEVDATLSEINATTFIEV